MTLQQLQFLITIHECGLNITLAARRLNISQPGISRQLRDLEAELGFQVFARQGRSLTHVTVEGEEIIERSARVLREIRNIRRVVASVLRPEEGLLSLATTHTQARYVLPQIIRSFRARHGGVRIHLHQGSSEQIASMMRREEVDFVILTGSQELFPESVGLPLYRWNRVVVVPKDHPLAADKPLTLQKLAAHPIVTYEFSFAGRSSLQAAFDTAGLTLDASLAAQDADVIKTYVRTGLGVGIVASMAVDARADSDLVVLDASHFLESHTTWLGFRRGLRLANYMYDFISELAPHLSRGLVRRVESATTQTAVDRMLRRVNVPWWGGI